MHSPSEHVTSRHMLSDTHTGPSEIQLPASHTPGRVQASPSSHGVLSGKSSLSHAPDAGLHVETKHGSSEEHATGSGCKAQIPWRQTADWTQRRSLGTVLRHSMSAVHETASGRVCVSQPHNIRRRDVIGAIQCVLTKASRYRCADVSNFTFHRVPVPFTRGQTSLHLRGKVMQRMPV